MVDDLANRRKDRVYPRLAVSRPSRTNAEVRGAVGRKVVR
jgi:hypothetical protein